MYIYLQCRRYLSSLYMFSFISSICLAPAATRPGATVEAVVCDGNVVGTATTDAAGNFTIDLGPVSTVLEELVLCLRNRCSAAVTTPLATCNASLGGGTLTATLQFLQARHTTITDRFATSDDVTFILSNGLFNIDVVSSGILFVSPGLFSAY